MPKRRKSLNSVDKQRDRDPQQQSSPECYEGERLDNVLANLLKSVELAKLSKTGQLPEKIWIKQQFAIGVNDVTRVLERMPPSEGKRDVPTKEVANGPLRRAPLVPLQIEAEWGSRRLNVFEEVSKVEEFSDGDMLRAGEILSRDAARANYFFTLPHGLRKLYLEGLLSSNIIKSSFFDFGIHTSVSSLLLAVLLASDCSPQLLSKHIPILASSRNVPVIFVKDKKGGSLRLGELVNLKTAIAIGVKDKGSCINRAIDEVLLGQATSH